MQRPGRGGRARRHLLVAGFVVAYLAACGVMLALGDRVTGGGWLAVHLVLFGAATNAIVVWSEHFAAALLRAAPVSERTATVRALALNLGVVAVLGGVHTGRPVLIAAGAWLVGAVVLAHAMALGARVGRALTGPLAGTVWFYVAASRPCSPVWAWACCSPAAPQAPPTPTGPCGWPTPTSTCSAGSGWPSWAPSSRSGRRCSAPAWCRAWGGRSAGRWPRWSWGSPSPPPGCSARSGWWPWPAWPATLPGWPLPSARSCGRCCAAGRTRRPPGCLAPVWAGWPSRSSSTWSRWPAAHRSSIWTSGSTGWFRPSWSALPCRC
jgi:hypothetical protein